MLHFGKVIHLDNYKNGSNHFVFLLLYYYYNYYRPEYCQIELNVKTKNSVSASFFCNYDCLTRMSARGPCVSVTINGNINNRQRYLLCNCHNNSTITHPDQYTGVTDSWQHQIDLLFSQHKNILTHFFGNGRFRTLIFLVRILLGFSIFTDKFWPNSGVRIMHEGVLYSWIYGTSLCESNIALPAHQSSPH